MALSMDEQRILAEIEKRLAADDPSLASCLSTFRRPGPGTVLRSPRARIIGSVFTVLLVALVSLMVYAMIPFRAHTVRNPVTPTAEAPSNPAFSAAGSSQQPGTPQASASTGSSGEHTTTASESNRPAGHSSGAATTAKTQATRAKSTGASAASATEP